MGYTKRQFVTSAFEEIGLADYVFDLQPEQLEAALRRLDSMMAEWNAAGIRLGYAMPSSPQDSDLDTETNVPDSAWEAIITNLAIRIALATARLYLLTRRYQLRELTMYCCNALHSRLNNSFHQQCH
jgi:hypothetical protein